MRNGLLILLTFVIFLTSSCAMKKVVMHYLDMQQGVPAKALIQRSTVKASTAFFTNCSLKIKTEFQNSTHNVLAILQAMKLHAPLALLTAFILVLLSLYYSSALGFRIDLLNGSFLKKIPIYIQLKQFIHYA